LKSFGLKQTTLLINEGIAAHTPKKKWKKWQAVGEKSNRGLPPLPDGGIPPHIIRISKKGKRKPLRVFFP
jgi:hypothetical protein